MMAFTILSFLSIQQLREANGIREMDENLEKMHSLSLEIFKSDADFFSYELNNSLFFKTGNSIYLRKHDSLLNQMRFLFKNPVGHQSEIDNDIERLLSRYDSLFDEIVAKIKSRGYRDFGIEGNMRSVAHKIEKDHLIGTTDYLTLRRYEKDFLLRSDRIYVDKFDSLLTLLKGRTPKMVSDLLGDYSESFHQWIAVSDSIGLESQANLKAKLDRLTLQLIEEIKSRDAKQDEMIFNEYRKGLILLAVGIIGSTLLCFILIMIIVRRL